MDNNNKEDQLSDEEIFYGKLSLKEIKHMLVINHRQRQTIAASELSKEDNHNNSLELISTQSAPDINKDYKHIQSPETEIKALSNATLSPNGPDIYSVWHDTSSENSFLKVEKLMKASGSLCDSYSKEGLDNTLEAIEKILNCAPERSPHKSDVVAAIKGNGINISPFKDAADQYGRERCLKSISSPLFTPVKQEKNEKEVFATPSSVLITKPSIMKTPANPPLFKKPSTSSVKKTPGKSNAFKHIASPVAYYIKNSPQVPLIQNVKPRKPLTGVSSIPKLIKTTTVKPSNKENINLPAVAYKSAKKTTVIDVSNGPKLPQSQWAKNLTKSLPKPVVMKHTHREKDFINKSLGKKQEDSFGDLSLQQADVSVYTKKAAF